MSEFIKTHTRLIHISVELIIICISFMYFIKKYKNILDRVKNIELRLNEYEKFLSQLRLQNRYITPNVSRNIGEIKKQPTIVKNSVVENKNENENDLENELDYEIKEEIDKLKISGEL